MFTNYILSAWRNLLKNKTVSIINIGGLTIGLASAVLAILFAHHELSYESCHEKADRISRVYTRGDFDQLQWIPTTFGPEGEALKKMFPEIEEYTRGYQGSALVRVGENIFNEDYIYCADSNFLNILTFPFVLGGWTTEGSSISISESTARRYFGTENPIGSPMSINMFGDKGDFVVTGVFKDLPSNTHLRVDFLLPFDYLKKYEFLKPDKYWSSGFITYLLLRSGTDIDELNRRIESSYKIPIDIENICSFLLPMKEIHMRGTWSNNKGKLIVFLFGGFFVLIITSLNYINLTNILFSTRNREIGIRKVNGARHKHIFIQFLTDTLLSTLIAFNLAIVTIKLILPWFNTLMDTNINIGSNRQTLLLMLAIFFITVLFSGLYPALRYSFQKPIILMRPVANSLGGKGLSRWVLTTFQFILAIIFIQFMLAVNSHNNYLGNDDYLKFNSENVFCISGYPWGDLNKVKTELLKNPTIEAVSWGSSVPEMGMNLTTSWKDKNNKIMASVYDFDCDYPDVFKISMLNGRFFSPDYPSDKEQGVVINQLTKNILGYDDPLGKKLMIYDKYYEIIGVIDSYRAVPPIIDLTPMLILQSDNVSRYLTIRVNPSDLEFTRKFIVSTLKKFNSEYPIELKYHIDLCFESKEAKSFISAAQLMNLFFVLTIITSLVGLFGLSLFIAQRKRREVGVRKVFGASITTIMYSLSKGIIVQVFIAILFATPISMIMVKGYLSVFPNNFHLGLPFYLMGGGLAMALVLITVGWQTWKAATENPTEAIRYE